MFAAFFSRSELALTPLGALGSIEASGVMSSGLSLSGNA